MYNILGGDTIFPPSIPIYMNGGDIMIDRRYIASRLQNRTNKEVKEAEPAIEESTPVVEEPVQEQVEEATPAVGEEPKRRGRRKKEETSTEDIIEEEVVSEENVGDE